MTFKSRFAPSPTGPLHLGHAYSALLAHDMATDQGGTFFLRIDDLDQSRSRPDWEQQIFDDLSWLGVTWPAPVWRQSDRLALYRDHLKTLWDKGLLYPCSCTRADIRAAASAPQEGAAILGPDGVIYPGICRPTDPPQGDMPDSVLRLDMTRAMAMLEEPLEFHELGSGPDGQSGVVQPINMCDTVGDVVLARRDMGASYHLSIVIDDADQTITDVVRGQDLFDATQIHVLLQKLLGLPTPIYHHHRLIRDDQGRRLAKRDDARAIATYRAEGLSPADMRVMLGL